MLRIVQLRKGNKQLTSNLRRLVSDLIPFRKVAPAKVSLWFGPAKKSQSRRLTKIKCSTHLVHTRGMITTPPANADGGFHAGTS